MDSLSPGRIYGTTSLDTGTNWRRLVPPPLFPTLWLAGATRVAAARHCLSAVAYRLVTRRSHTIVAARRQVCRHHVVVTLLAAVLALNISIFLL